MAKQSNKRRRWCSIGKAVSCGGKRYGNQHGKQMCKIKTTRCGGRLLSRRR